MSGLSSSSGRDDKIAANVQREVATVMKALAPMGGTKEQSDACIALGRLAAWAEAGLAPRFAIRAIPTEESEDDLDLRY